jgi:hypothetical protein
MHTGSSLHWKEIFMQAMNESDGEKLHRLVGEAESAIFLRREQLGDSAEDHEELSTMQWEQFGKSRNEEERRKREKNERNGLTLTGLLMEGLCRTAGPGGAKDILARHKYAT